ncbi:2454_t:CDS:2, partial [Paraglomus occultum]
MAAVVRIFDCIAEGNFDRHFRWASVQKEITDVVPLAKEPLAFGNVRRAILKSGEDTVKDICRLMTEFGKIFPNHIAKCLTPFGNVLTFPFIFIMLDRRYPLLLSSVNQGTLSYEEAQKIKQAAVILFQRLIEILRVKLQLLTRR